MIRSPALAFALLLLAATPALAEQFPCPPIVFSSWVQMPWINQACSAPLSTFAPVTPIAMGCQNCFTGAEPFGQPFDTPQCNTGIGPDLIQTLIPQQRNSRGQCVPAGSALPILLDEHSAGFPSDRRMRASLTQGTSTQPTHGSVPDKAFTTAPRFSDHFGGVSRPVVVSHPDHPGRP